MPGARLFQGLLYDHHFLVPPDNCNDAIDAPRGDMRLVRAETMSEALAAVEDWTADHDADLPHCADDPGSSGA